MDFHVDTEIARAPETVFASLRDIDQGVRPRSLVPVLEKATPGPVSVGTRYREIVRLLPGLSAHIVSEIAIFEPGAALGLRFEWRCAGTRMAGTLLYRLLPAGDGATHLIQEQTLHPHGILRFLAPWIRRTFQRRIERRILDLKDEIERDLSWRHGDAAGRLAS